MKPKSVSVWLPFGFSAILSAIVLVANIAGSFLTGSPDAGMIALICFLPMTFFFAAASHGQTREHIKDLETRIHQLEAREAAP